MPGAGKFKNLATEAAEARPLRTYLGKSVASKCGKYTLPLSQHSSKSGFMYVKPIQKGAKGWYWAFENADRKETRSANMYGVRDRSPGLAEQAVKYLEMMD